MRQLVEGLGFEVASVTPGTARRMAEAYARWGKGVHPAGLNFGDCFAYVLAIEHDAPLLYVGVVGNVVLLAYVVIDDPGSLYWVAGLLALGATLYLAQRVSGGRRRAGAATDGGS